MPARAEVSHAVPGRLRLRVAGGGDAERDEILGAVKRLSKEPGVENVRTDARTGSALLTYDPEELDIEGMFRLLREAHLALQGVAPPRVSYALDRSLSTVASGVHQTLSHANQRVLESTHGVLDLRMLTPLSLAAFSARQLMRYGPGVAKIPWYVLAYYSFDTFIKLHAERIGGQQPQRQQVGGPN